MCPLLIFLWLGLSECFSKAVTHRPPTGLCQKFGNSLPNEMSANPADTAKGTSATIVIGPMPLPKDSLVKDRTLWWFPGTFQNQQ